MSAPIKTIAVLGAGPLGRGLAYIAARSGYRTILEDLSGQIIDGALDEIRKTAAEEAHSQIISAAEAQALLARVEPERELDRAVAEADLVLEAAPEDLETKTEVYTIIDRAAPPACVFASAASSLSITEIASFTYRAPQVLGMHFSSPVLKTRLLELIKGLETSAEALAAAEQVGLRMGREVVLVKERSL